MTTTHDWIPSTLGHGNQMCRRCAMTDREAAALGLLNQCAVPLRKTPQTFPDLPERLRAAYNAMTPLEKAIHDARARRNYIVSEMMTNDDGSPNGRTKEEAMKAYQLLTAEGAMLDYIDDVQLRIARLHDALKHGDDDHKKWLREAIDAHFSPAGLPVPAPYGKATHEQIWNNALDDACSVVRSQLGMTDQADNIIASLRKNRK